MPIDYNLYPKDWDARSRFIRFYRAKNKCEWCGVENGSIGARSPVNGRWYTQRDIDGMKSDCGWNLWPDGYPKTIRIVLTVAHVYYMDKMNASLLNLAALCNRCHLNHDREQHMANARTTREKKMGLLRLWDDQVEHAGFASKDRTDPSSEEGMDNPCDTLENEGA